MYFLANDKENGRRSQEKTLPQTLKISCVSVTVNKTSTELVFLVKLIAQEKVVYNFTYDRAYLHRYSCGVIVCEICFTVR